jgi:hypothetical protein
MIKSSMSNSSGTAQSSAMERRVTFDTSRNTVQIVRRIPASEVADCFMTEQDFQQRQNEDQRIIQHLDHSSSATRAVLNKEYCLRGLESRTRLGRIHRRRLREDSMSVVLEEHWYQKLEGWFNPETIANVYEKYSMLAMEEAQWLAKQDAQFVLDEACKEQQRRQRLTRKRPSQCISPSLASSAKPLAPPPTSFSITQKKQRTNLKSFVRNVLLKRGTYQ